MNFPSRLSRIKSASFSTDRCRDMEAAVTEKQSVISPADILPFFKRLRIFRRVGSARARRVFCRDMVSPPLTFNLIVNYMIAPGKEFVNRPS